MDVVKYGSDVVSFYVDIEEIRERNREKFDMYAVLSSELNPKLSSFDKKITSLLNFIENDKKDEAKEAVNNLHKSISLTTAGHNLNRVAFGALIKSVNRMVIDDLSDENLDSIVSNLKGITTKDIDDRVNNTKKKFLQN